jgi:FkbM family methyltransferase
MELLAANVNCNDLANLDLLQLALSDYVGKARFTVFERGSGLASFAPEGRGGREVDVAVTTLDRLTAPFADRVAVVKLDIEGAEVQAIRGAAALIDRAAPIFVIEVEPTHLARQGASVGDLMSALEPHGYEAFAITACARLTKIHASWYPPEPSIPSIVLASPTRSERVRELLSHM